MMALDGEEEVSGERVEWDIWFCLWFIRVISNKLHYAIQ